MPAKDNELASQHKLLHNQKLRQHLPPFSGSPFGDFPADYGSPAKSRSVKKTTAGDATVYHTPDEQPQTLKSTAATSSFLRARTGTGGLSVSTMKPASKKPAAGSRGPPKAGAYRQNDIPSTEFRRYYERGDLPISIQHRSNGRTIAWKVEIEKLDYHHYLPIFFDGLRELEEPYKFIAFQGCLDLLEKGGQKILPTIPQLIIPLKIALNSKNADIMCAVLIVMQKLVVSGELIGEALVPYYRQLLPVLNLFKNRNTNIGDGIEYGQRKRSNLGDLVHETLQTLELHGGEDAFINIKYMVPTYESCVLN